MLYFIEFASLALCVLQQVSSEEMDTVPRLNCDEQGASRHDLLYIRSRRGMVKVGTPIVAQHASWVRVFSRERYAAVIFIIDRTRAASANQKTFSEVIP
ncbi:hypothetical protein B0T11DRAFT_21000 [Plectosphaerella cucumerina]|uniref:Secreted protein n=1 Tax=Plectosphaerella cucumerina TaxID=40658 RepID=A0A8K0XAH7_9PEZI|nr:hypothetical protein B0T11DRAFT_21000 [Plectosphaerella cucumerina]